MKKRYFTFIRSCMAMCLVLLTGHYLVGQQHAVNDFLDTEPGKVVSTSSGKGLLETKAGVVSYSETFTQFSTYCPGSSQFDNWGNFRASLDPNVIYVEAKVSGTNDGVGLTCDDPCLNQQIAEALKNGTALSVFCNGNWWTVRGESCHTGCSNSSADVELRVDPVSQGMCFCDNPAYTFRPCIGNSNWGGINSATCGAPTQTMTVEFIEGADCVTQFPFNVTDEEICPPGGVSTTIELTGSEVGVNYSLRNDADNTVIDGPIAGTGGAIVFNTGTINTSTTFNIFADKPGTCSEEFCNNPVVTVQDTEDPLLSGCHSLTLQLDGSNQATLDPNDFFDGGTQTQTFGFTGDVQTFVVPAGVTSVNIEAWGAQGGFDGGTAGGMGGYATGDLSVTPGETLYLYVGGQGTNGPGSGQNCGLAGGWNGGGNTGSVCCSNAGGGAGAGGGASDVRQSGQSLNDRVIVAGAGGGAGSGNTGAHGGGLTGNNGGTYNSVTATGGTQVAGGQHGGHFNSHACSEGTDGSFGQGGEGDGNDGGGGGGGWYGGGGGPNNGGGAGGSSYIDGVVNGSTSTGVRSGDGQIILSWTRPGLFTVTDNCGISHATLSKTSFGCGDVGTQSITFTVFDNGGNSSSCNFNVTVQDTTPPTVTCKALEFVLCPDEKVTLSPTDLEMSASDNCGIASRSLSRTVFSGKALGTHQVELTVTDIGGNSVSCTGTVTIVAPDPFAVDLVNAGPFEICEIDGSVKLLPSQAFAAYQWMRDGVDILGATDRVYVPNSGGDYSVRVWNDLGCSSVSNVAEVIELNQSDLVLTARPDQFACDGELVTLQADPDVYDEYVWMRNGTVLAQSAVNLFNVSDSGRYEVAVVDENGCAAVSNHKRIDFFAVPETPIIELIDGELVVTNAPAGATFEWFRNGDPIGATGSSYTPTATSQYSVVVTSADGCSAESEPFAFVGIVEAVKSGFYKVYPNPAHDWLYVEGLISGDRLQVYSAVGALVYDSNAGGDKVSIRVEDLPKGAYTLKISGERGIFHQSFVR